MFLPPSPEPAVLELPLALSDLPARRARILAFDTSTEGLCVAVCGASGAFTLHAAGGAAASATLLPHALRLLAQAGLRLDDLDAIAFGSGPGAFTGLRTACAVAQGLGLGLGLPLLALDSLLLVAEDARLQQPPVCEDAGAFEVAVAMDARMNEVYAARYSWHGLGADSGPHEGAWQVLQAPGLFGLPALAQAWAGLPLPVVAGSALTAFGQHLPLLPQTHCLPVQRNRGAALLQLALRAWAAGQAVDAAQALPLYVRDKVAHTTQERETARALGAGPQARTHAATHAAAALQQAPLASGERGQF